jgi:hypothetical protein
MTQRELLAQSEMLSCKLFPHFHGFTPDDKPLRMFYNYCREEP